MSDKQSTQELILVGGGAGIIGSSIVNKFLEEGRQTFSLDSKYSDSTDTQVKIDLTDTSQINSFFKKVFDSKSYQRVALVNCQGLSAPKSGPLEELSLKSWRTYFSTNLDSYFLTCRELLRHKSSFQKASIINLSSTRHFMAEKDTEAYCATKGAITSFTQALAISQTGSNVRVNSISPGWIAKSDAELREIDHKQHPVGRVGIPRDIAELCFYLASESSSFMTGQDIVIDGGMTRKMIYQ